MAKVQKSFLQVKESLLHFQYSFKIESGALVDYIYEGQEVTFTASPEAMAEILRHQGFIDWYTNDLMVTFTDAESMNKCTIGIEVFLLNEFKESDWKSLIASEIISVNKSREESQEMLLLIDDMEFLLSEIIETNNDCVLTIYTPAVIEEIKKLKIGDTYRICFAAGYIDVKRIPLIEIEYPSCTIMH